MLEYYVSAYIDFFLLFSPLPKTSVPREQLPMRDATFFTTRNKVPRPPQALVPVPHGGLKSEQKDQYTHPSDVKVKEANYCPVDTPYVLPSMKIIIVVKPVIYIGDHIKQDIFLAFQTGCCLLLHESSAQSSASYTSFLHYFHSAISNHLQITISVSSEWPVA